MCVCFLDSFQPGGAYRCRYQVVPGSCRGGSLSILTYIKKSMACRNVFEIQKKCFFRAAGVSTNEQTVVEMLMK